MGRAFDKYVVFALVSCNAFLVANFREELIRCRKNYKSKSGDCSVSFDQKIFSKQYFYKYGKN